MDSLRYWVTEMHVDGFRFDLAATLAREFYDVDRLSSFFELVQQDPTVSQVKLIAEPWDIGPGGYQVGNFPPQWTEWNGKYRDTVRDFWRGEPATLGEFAARLTGSADLYEHYGAAPGGQHQLRHRARRLHAARPGLLQREAQRGQRRGQQRRREPQPARGTAASRARPTTPRSCELRARQQRNFIATLLLSQGVPMLCHGDELGRTQQGNNNGYCQDNELTWIDWDTADEDLIAFTGEVAALRREHPTFRRRRFFDGRPIKRKGEASAARHRLAAARTAAEMTEEDWDSGFGRAVAVFLNGAGIAGTDERGGPITDDSFLLCFSAHHEPIDFQLPGWRDEVAWQVVLDTSITRGRRRPSRSSAGGTVDGAAADAGRPAEGELIAAGRHPELRPTGCRSGSGSRWHAAAELADYLRALGAGAIYLSPILQATSGSDHGYDITSHRGSIPNAAARTAGWRWPHGPARRAWRSWSTSCPTTWGWPTPAQNEAWWQLLRLGQDSRVRRAGSTSTGRPATAGSGCRCSAMTSSAASSAWSMANCVTSSTDSRSRRAPSGRRRQRRPQVHDRQHYELVGYRRADAEQNYRRFFAVTELAGIRVEDPAVFEATHAEMLRWVETVMSTESGSITRTAWPTRPVTWTGWPPHAPRRWITVEKITEPGERLPAAWPVAGTTGYDALAELNALLYDPAAEDEASAATPS